MPAPDRDSPWLIYGTAWKEARTESLTKLALDQGFRAIDTANQRRHYVEAAVGKAVCGFIDQGAVTRADLFLQTKYTFLGGQDHRLPYDPDSLVADQVEQSCASSFAHLKTHYLDAFLLHGPSRRFGLGPDDWHAWRAMESLHDTGKVKRIGISNVDARQLNELIDGSRIMPAIVQNRCFARTRWDKDVRAVCAEYGIDYQGFSVLTANAGELGKPEIRAIASEAGVTVAQLVFAFARQIGISVLTGTTNPIHMQHDLASTSVTLSDLQIKAIEQVAFHV